MSERIIIELGGEEEKPKEAKERIVIDFGEEKKKIEIENIEATGEEKILNSKVNSSFRGNSHLNNSYETGL